MFILLSQVFGLLSNLGEKSDQIFAKFSHSGLMHDLISFLIPCSPAFIYAKQLQVVAVTAAQFLQVYTEPAECRTTVTKEDLAAMRRLIHLTNISVHIQVLLVAALLNISPTAEFIVQDILPVLMHAIKADFRAEFSFFLGHIASKERTTDVIASRHKLLMDNMHIKETALETLTNLVCEECVADVNGKPFLYLKNACICDVLFASVSQGREIEAKTANVKSLIPSLNLSNDLEQGALVCLNNMFLFLDISHLANVPDVWIKLGPLTTFVKHKPKLLEASLIALLSLLRNHGKPLKPVIKSDIPIKQMMIFAKHDSISVRCCSMAIISVLGKRLGALPFAKDLLVLVFAVVKEALTHPLAEENVVALITEAMNVIFEVFGKDEYDAFTVSTGLVADLQILVPVLQKKLQAAFALTPEAREEFDAVLQNTLGFIAYKKG
eukprot:TRINITY_DN91_c0_g1_i3.p1 TRINITY_DN91_c0_g1~~TRINITY_DN91_c0_g1_i3.p1  ORF type:complete len:438 (-),score=33.22 TRINITY_DN91_c0_g1_i3:32-1345(-)